MEIKEIRLNINDEFLMNLVSYFTIDENYTYVGNNDEIWLENLAHPRVQLIYINHKKEFTEGHAAYIFKKMQLVKNRIQMSYLMPHVKGLVLNLNDYDEASLDYNIRNVPFATVNDADDIATSSVLRKKFPNIVHTNFRCNFEELAMKMAEGTKNQALSLIGNRAKVALPWVTYTFLGMMVVFFGYLRFQALSMHSNFVGISYGAKYNPLIVAGEYHRLLASAFIHMDVMHLLFNAIFIFRFGRLVEDAFGGARVVLIMLVSAVLGTLFSFAFSTSFGWGASTVAFGIIGAIIFLGFEDRKRYMPLVKHSILPIIGMSILFDMMMPNVDSFAHFGGFVGGFLAATFVGLPKVRLFLMRSVLTILTMIVLAGGLFSRGVAITEAHDFEGFNRAIVSSYIEQGNFERAVHLIEILDIDFSDLLDISE